MFNRRRNSNGRTYSLTAYTGVGEAPPNRRAPNPSAVAAASLAGGGGRTASIDSTLSSAAAATALRRHSSIDRSGGMQRSASVMSDMGRRPLSPDMTSSSSMASLRGRGNGTRGSSIPRSASSSGRSNSITLSTNVTMNNDGRTMSLTTVRKYGSFEITKTTQIDRRPIIKPSGKKPGYAPSFESDLGTVNEEDDFRDFTTQQQRQTGAARKVASPVSSSSSAGKQDSSRLQVKRDPPRAMSPIKPALKDASRTSSADSSAGDKPVRRNRVSFMETEEVVEVYPAYDYEDTNTNTGKSSNFKTPKSPSFTAAAAKLAQQQQDDRTAKANSRVSDRTSANAAMAASNLYSPDSESSLSNYSDAVEDMEVLPKGDAKSESKRVEFKKPSTKSKKPDHGYWALVDDGEDDEYREDDDDSTVTRTLDPKVNGHSSRPHQGINDGDIDSEDDAASLNSDSSWKRNRNRNRQSTPNQAAEPKRFRTSMREERPLASNGSMRQTLRPQPSLESTRPASGRGFRTHSLRGNYDEASLNKLSKKLAHEMAAEDNVRSSVVPSSGKKNGVLKRLTLRETSNGSTTNQSPRLDQEYTYGGFKSRIIDSDSESDSGRPTMPTTTILNTASHESQRSGSGGFFFKQQQQQQQQEVDEKMTQRNLHKSVRKHEQKQQPESGTRRKLGFKEVFSPNTPAKALLPKQSSAKLRSASAEVKSTTTPKKVEMYGHGLGHDFNDTISSEDGYGKKKRFQGLRKVFGIK